MSKRKINSTYYKNQISKRSPYVQEMRNAIQLYDESKIEREDSLRKIFNLLKSRGEKNNQKGLELLNKFKVAEPATGKINRERIKKAPRIQNYFVKGYVKTVSKYSRTRAGEQKFYDKEYHEKDPMNRTIPAKSKEDAIEQFNQQAHDAFTRGSGREGPQYVAGGGNSIHQGGSDEFVETDVVDVFIDDVVVESSYTPGHESNSMMREAFQIEYSFIPADDKHLINPGFCVPDQIDAIYGKLNKKLSRDNFIKQCHDIESKSRSVDNALNYGIDDDINEWKIEDGVRTSTLNQVLKNHDISFYTYDVCNNCFDKYISRSQNYPALVYYSVNNHMYWIGDQKKALSLTRKARDIESKIHTHMIEDNFESQNIYLDGEMKIKPIFENIPVEDLMDEKYNNSIIIYNNKTEQIIQETKDILVPRVGVWDPLQMLLEPANITVDKTIFVEKNDLNEELDKIIAHHNHIPTKLKHREYSVIRIIFEKEGRNIILSSDVNTATKNITYHDIVHLCGKHGVEFKNQTFGALIQDIRKKRRDEQSSRIKLKKDKRIELLEKFNKKCNCCEKSITNNQFQIDHIKPLAAGGDNSDENLQVLCKDCHYEKTKEEHDNNQYVKISDTESSYNKQTYEIINSDLSSCFAFVERFIPYEPTNKLLFKFDLNKSRKNAMYYSKFDYPVFTVMDQVRKYDSQYGYNKPGLYFVVSDNYFPLRGNGWYSQAMISYCISINVIAEKDIKFVVYAAPEIAASKDYFNDLIDYFYGFDDDYKKLAVNTMIGGLKPKPRENYKTICINTDRNVAFYHHLRVKGDYIDSRDINGTTYYQVYEKFTSESLETETPIYNMAVELEIIELHKLCKLIEAQGGTVLDVNTDAAICMFPGDTCPFKKDVEGNVVGYYFDDESKIPKYKLEANSERIKHQLLAKWIRTDDYKNDEIKWKTIQDRDDNDFQSLVDQILDSKQCYHIRGRAGTGKSTLIKLLMKTMKDKKLHCEATAPTNKACRIINGKTIHKFIAAFNLESFKKKNIKYIFIDEISMVHEIFYKFFIGLKRMIPEIKFIVAGDFEQLLPVKDRLKNCYYANSLALKELCDGNMLMLSKCRRSDDTLYNMLLPHNIDKINKTTFGNKLTERHLARTNIKRKEINHVMMCKAVKEKKRAPLELPKLKYDKNSQNVRLLNKMPIIARINTKDYDIYNNETFTIKKIDFDSQMIIIIDDVQTERLPIEIPFKEFQRLFYVAYCITVCRSQGSTYNHDYTLHEFERYDNRMKYVALSRATDVKHIHIV